MCFQFAFPPNKFKVDTNRVEIAPKLQRNYFLSGFVSWHIHLRQKIVSLCMVKMKKHMYFAQYLFTEESQKLIFQGYIFKMFFHV